MDNLNKEKGIFISIDGSDGSGKTTQTMILVEKLRRLNYEVETIKFPQYGKKSAGIIEEYLNGKYGHADDVNPYTTSILYATDRFDAKEQIENWLSEGKIVISDRYVSANMGHQGGKIETQEERKEFFEWLYNLEYEIFKVPKPDINIILHVDSDISKNLLDNLAEKSYIKKSGQDIHESDTKHLKKANEVFLELNDLFNDFTLINCSPDNTLLDIENISQKIWMNLPPLLTEEKSYSPDFKDLHDKEIEEFSNILKVEKIFDNAKLPSRGYKHDAGLDLYSAESKTIYPGERAIIRTGIRLAIPEGHVGLIWDKSGIAKSGLNTMGGVVDAGFRGELTINIANVSNDIYNIDMGQKIAQLLIQKIELPLILETKINDETERGESSYGSSGLY